MVPCFWVLGMFLRGVWLLATCFGLFGWFCRGLGVLGFGTAGAFRCSFVVLLFDKRLYHRGMLLSSVVSAVVLGSAELPPLTVRGADLVDPLGRVVILKGTNLGNWFVIEPWMLNIAEGEGSVSDQVEFEAVLAERFGATEKNRLMEAYRENWIKEEDFGVIRSFGFNVVRLPMNYRQFEDDARPYQLREDAFQWTDRAVKWAGANGLYVILDMHGAQGGQSPYDHTGHAGQNKLWSEPESSKRLAWLWGELAKRYKDEPAVVAYDVFNEPYGGTHETQNRVFREVYPVIRKHDPDTLIFAHGHTDTFTHYGTNAENGWRNVGYQMHYYPGMFGNGEPTPMTHAKHLQFLSGVAEDTKRFGAPFLVGEMNVVFQAAGGGPLMRKTFDTHASYGWHTTMWSYKVLSQVGGHGEASWGMVTNAEILPRLNLRSDSKETIEAWFRGLSTMELEVNRPLFEAMTAAVAPEVSLPEPPAVRRTAPADVDLAGWSKADVGGSRVGGLEDLGGGRIALYGGGNDVWGGQDQFRFLYQRLRGDFVLEVDLQEVEDIEAYTKAGLMVRAGLETDAAHFLLSSFPSGELQAAWRATRGGQTEAGGEPSRAVLPGVRLRVSRTGDVFAAAYRQGDGVWTEIRRQTLPGMPDEVLAGAIALSHDNGRLVRIVYRGLRVLR